MCDPALNPTRERTNRSTTGPPLPTMSTAPLAAILQQPWAPSAPPIRAKRGRSKPPLCSAHLQARSAMRESAMQSALLPLSIGRRAKEKVFVDLRQPAAGAGGAGCLQQKGVRATRGAQAEQRRRMMRARRATALR